MSDEKLDHTLSHRPIGLVEKGNFVTGSIEEILKFAFKPTIGIDILASQSLRARSSIG